MKIVIADDAVLFRERVKMLLAELPEVHVVGEAGNGVEALALIQATRPHVAIVDIHMPGANGLHVLRETKRQVPETIVIMVTNESSWEYRSFCLALRADFFFDKVVEFDLVRETIQTLSMNTRQGSAHLRPGSPPDRA